MKHGSVVISAITSCTNTSNPSVMLGNVLLTVTPVKTAFTTLSHCFPFRRRSAGKEGSGEGPLRGTVHQDEHVSGQWSGHLLPSGVGRHALSAAVGL